MSSNQLVTILVYLITNQYCIANTTDVRIVMEMCVGRRYKGWWWWWW